MTVHPDETSPAVSRDVAPAVAPAAGRRLEHDPGRQRFRCLVGGSELGVLDYQASPGVPRSWDLLHTYTDPAARGLGVAADLVEYAMNTAREQGVTVVPSCSYVAFWLGDHPGYADLVEQPL